MLQLKTFDNSLSSLVEEIIWFFAFQIHIGTVGVFKEDQNVPDD